MEDRIVTFKDGSVHYLSRINEVKFNNLLTSLKGDENIMSTGFPGIDKTIRRKGLAP